MDCRRFLGGFGPGTHGGNRSPGASVGGLVIDNWRRVVAPDPTAGPLLPVTVEQPGGVNVGRGDMRQFGDLTANKNAFGVVIDALFDGVVDANSAVARCTRLHLHLAVVNAWFVVDPATGQNQ